MSADIAVIAPVLARPQNAWPLAESLHASTDRARLSFVCSPDDQQEIFACQAVCEAFGGSLIIAPDVAGPGDYARKIQLGYDLTAQPLVLCAADDLRFAAGWLEEVEAAAAEYDCGVIGTNDRANPTVIAGHHSTHPVVRRCYIDRYGGVVGIPGQIYSPEYHHNYVDNELVATAIARGCYHHCAGAVVEHLHHLWRTAPIDETYRLGSRSAARDRRLFESRRHLWEREQVLS